MRWPKITPAKIVVRDDQAYESTEFGDIYHMPGQGAEEKTHVFLDGIGLGNLLTSTKALTVGELGFGAGLNFLLTWQKARQSNARLDYFAIEGFPMTPADLAALYRDLDGLSDETDALIKSYPPLMPGFHRLVFDHGRVTLTLVFGDALDSLQQMSGSFDAWYLDGFSPDKNPEMWSPEVFAEIARLSKKGARLATYSAAGSVKRGFETAGFAIEKRPGFAKKRDSLAAAFTGKGAARGLPPGSRVAVIGGGIAGCSTAYALSNRGYEVHLYEKENKLAPGTSGHQLAVFKLKLQRGYSAYSAFFLDAHLYSLSLYEMLDKDFGGVWHPARGCLQVAGSAKTHADLKRLAETFPALSGHVEVREDGLFYPRGGCVDPESLCHLLTANAHVHLGQTSDGKDFNATVYANGRHAYACFADSPFRLTRGQSNYLPALKDPLPYTLSFSGGYLTPATRHGVHILGTSFEVCENPESEDWQRLSEENFKTNLAALSRVAPELSKAWTNAPLDGRIALRTETIDHLPAVGPAFDPGRLEVVFREKQKLHHSQRVIGGEADIPNAFVFSGFASRGFTAAPYAAEILAAQIAGAPRPCPAFIEAALDPKRFHLKDLKKS